MLVDTTVEQRELTDAKQLVYVALYQTISVNEAKPCVFRIADRCHMPSP